GLSFLESHVGGEHEGFDAQAEGVPEGYEPAQEGELHDRVPVYGGVERLSMHDDTAVGGAHRHGHVPLPAHHHPLDTSLPAVVKPGQDVAPSVCYAPIVPDGGDR